MGSKLANPLFQRETLFLYSEAARNLLLALEGDNISIFQGWVYKHSWKIIQNKGNHCLFLQGMKKHETPMENCLPMLFKWRNALLNPMTLLPLGMWIYVFFLLERHFSPPTAPILGTNELELPRHWKMKQNINFGLLALAEGLKQ